MNKGVLIGGVVLVALAGAAYFGAGMLAGAGDAPAEAIVAAGEAAGGAGSTGDPNQPERTAEVKGAVISVEGTMVTIDRLLVDASAELTDEEKAAKKAERQSMTMEERQAAKAAELEGVATERVTVEIPVGVTITRMVSEADGPTAKPASLADIKSGSSVSIWTDGKTDGGVAEYVKIQAGM